MDFYLPDALLNAGRFQPGLGLLVEGSTIIAVCREADAPSDARSERLSGHLAPGYVEIQINGCGGVIFTQEPSVDAIGTMHEVLEDHGVTSFLPTLITAPAAVIEKGIEATRQAKARFGSVLGMHLEGPHLSLNKPGTHDQSLIRPMSENDQSRIAGAADAITLLTIAFENARLDQMEVLSATGMTLALGHTTASAAETLEAHARGVSMLTHLYNGMQGMSGRDPGPVGAAFDSPTLGASIIADGFHVDDIAIRAAHRAMGDRLVLTSDATASVEGGNKPFEFGGYRCQVEDGVVRNHLGGLAGAAVMLDVIVARMARIIGDKALAVRMGSELPARLIGWGDRIGRLAPGYRADFNLLDPETLAVRRVWARGTLAHSPH